MTATRADVLVVGAGAAGLSAARQLRAHGRSVLVLEARDRIGGRVLTLHDPRIPLPIELGAEFIHGDAPITTALLAEAGQSSLDVSGSHGEAHRGTVRRVAEALSIDRVLHRIDTQAPDETVAEFLAHRPGGRALERERGQTRRFVEGFHAADVTRISAQSIAPEPGESGAEMAAHIGRPTQGYHALMAWLARDLGPSLRLESAVCGITWDNGKATVDARGPAGRKRRFSGRAVVVTVPIGVLQAPASAAGGIAFDPEPRRLRRALEGIEMGHVTRVVVWFHSFPWDGASRFQFIHLHDGPFQVLWTAHPIRWPVAVLWCGGPASATLDGSRDQVRRVVEAQLAAAFGMKPKRIHAGIRALWWHDWSKDPYARGAYSYVKAGARNPGRDLSRPEGRTLFFAGEAAGDDTGTVEAALESGRRAARQVQRALP
ncbi:MAG TPA: NAD(P)/FAD-dependent oxidoreductase [Candidatus Eisenbacteria bacterium]|nr:NAD(P)/FAD-dependent oxidoreductase [Candidatus Eisenbacteria bacterium]